MDGSGGGRLKERWRAELKGRQRGRIGGGDREVLLAVVVVLLGVGGERPVPREKTSFKSLPCVSTESSVGERGEGQCREGREIEVGGERECEGGDVGLEGVGRWGGVRVLGFRDYVLGFRVARARARALPPPFSLSLCVGRSLLALVHTSSTPVIVG